MELLYDPEISLLALHPQKLKVRAQTDTCTPMLIAALFAIAKDRNKLTPSTEQTNNM